jgi:hypothetical protein
VLISGVAGGAFGRIDSHAVRDAGGNSAFHGGRRCCRIAARSFFRAALSALMEARTRRSSRRSSFARWWVSHNSMSRIFSLEACHAARTSSKLLVRTRDMQNGSGGEILRTANFVDKSKNLSANECNLLISSWNFSTRGAFLTKWSEKRIYFLRFLREG